MIVWKSLAYARLLAYCTKQTLTYTKYATGLFCLSWHLHCPLGVRKNAQLKKLLLIDNEKRKCYTKEKATIGGGAWQN